MCLFMLFMMLIWLLNTKANPSELRKLLMLHFHYVVPTQLDLTQYFWSTFPFSGKYCLYSPWQLLWCHLQWDAADRRRNYEYNNTNAHNGWNRGDGIFDDFMETPTACFHYMVGTCTTCVIVSWPWPCLAWLGQAAEQVLKKTQPGTRFQVMEMLEGLHLWVVSLCVLRLQVSS